MWLVVGAVAVVLVATGVVPLDDARAVVVDRGAPIMVFLVGITVLADRAGAAGVFEAAAGACARLARGSVPRLFALLAALGVAVTTTMSLDTTAVLLTPVVIATARRARLPVAPFALLAVWLANTASLVLPVANLTNLLAVQRAHLSSAAFAARMLAPAVVVALLAVGVVWFVSRRDLRGRCEVAPAPRAPDRAALLVCAAACAALAPGVLLGAPPWAVACAAALVAVVTCAARGLGRPSFGALPWRAVVLTLGLFVAVSAATDHGLTPLLARVAGTSAWRTAAAGAVASNAVNNLPAYLALEPAVPAGATTQLLALLIGVGAGPLLTPWASLATLLWRERCAAEGVVVPARRFVALGAVGAPVLVAAGVGALLLSRALA